MLRVFHTSYKEKFTLGDYITKPYMDSGKQNSGYSPDDTGDIDLQRDVTSDSQRSSGAQRASHVSLP